MNSLNNGFYKGKKKHGDIIGGASLEKITSHYTNFNGENIAHPHRYQSSSGMECIDAISAITEDKSGCEAFMIGNIVKYLWRYKKKNGIEDVKKAKVYMDMLIEKLEEKSEVSQNRVG